MKKLILILFLFFSYSSYSQQIRVVQINAKWNQQNTLYLENLRGCKYDYAWLEDQGPKLKSQIKSVPVILIEKNGKIVRTFQAGLDFKLDVNSKFIQDLVYELKKDG
jgi:hypothetical protein|tara:strand:+ start:42 stop:362 length:321 start_codon:yes stop_codon:yes gene_type:complete